jgi:uncharacterized membrane protein
VIASTQLLVAVLWHIVAIPAAELWDVFRYGRDFVLFSVVISTLVGLLITWRFRSGKRQGDQELRVYVHIASLTKVDELEGARLQRYGR